MGWVIYGGGWCRRLAVAKQKGAVARVSAQNKRNTLRSTSQNNTYERKRKNNARETRPASKAAQPPRPQEPQRKYQKLKIYRSRPELGINFLPHPDRPTAEKIYS